jgi:hypothetical protein
LRRACRADGAINVCLALRAEGMSRFAFFAALRERKGSPARFDPDG